MIMDKQLCFSEAQTIAVAAGTVVSTNSIDLGVAGTPAIGGTIINDIGRGRAIQVVAEITTAVTSGGSATVQAQLIMSDNADLSSPTVLSETAAIAVATLIAGYQFRIGNVPPGITKRYLGMQYVVGTATTTAGKVTAGLVFDRQSNPSV